jgi:hypothetical protein
MAHLARFHCTQHLSSAMRPSAHAVVTSLADRDDAVLSLSPRLYRHVSSSPTAFVHPQAAQQAGGHGQCPLRGIVPINLLPLLHGAIIPAIVQANPPHTLVHICAQVLASHLYEDLIVDVFSGSYTRCRRQQDSGGAAVHPVPPLLFMSPPSTGAQCMSFNFCVPFISSIQLCATSTHAIVHGARANQRFSKIQQL